MHLSGVFIARQSICGYQGEVHRAATSRFLNEGGKFMPQLGIFTRFRQNKAHAQHWRFRAARLPPHHDNQPDGGRTRQAAIHTGGRGWIGDGRPRWGSAVGGGSSFLLFADFFAVDDEDAAVGLVGGDAHSAEGVDYGGVLGVGFDVDGAVLAGGDFDFVEVGALFGIGG